jgi:hypothetical protein
MPGNQYGLAVSIDGPAPSPPALTLANAARIVTSGDDRWINGASTLDWPTDLPDVFDTCQQTSSSGHAKDAGTPAGSTDWASFTILQGVTCTTASFYNPDEWINRARTSLEAREDWRLGYEFWTGALQSANPHLTGTGVTSLNGGSATSVLNAVALLEQEIADKGGDGVIHMRLAPFTQLSLGYGGAVTVKSGVAYTQAGTKIVPSVGYPGLGPANASIATTIDWAYATGPIELRRSEVQVVPGSMSEATLREQNLTTFRAERHVLLTWDQRIHAAAKIDRAFTTFTS